MFVYQIYCTVSNLQSTSFRKDYCGYSTTAQYRWCSCPFSASLTSLIVSGTNIHRQCRCCPVDCPWGCPCGLLVSPFPLRLPLRLPLDSVGNSFAPLVVSLIAPSLLWLPFNSSECTPIAPNYLFDCWPLRLRLPPLSFDGPCGCSFAPLGAVLISTVNGTNMHCRWFQSLSSPIPTTIFSRNTV